MKTKFNLRILRFLALSASLLPAANAAEGTHTGGGGDASEARVDEIRADILRWVSKGGAKTLKLPARLTYETYVSSMTAVLKPQAVVLSFVTTQQERATDDPELKVIVDSQPKTCRGFVSIKDRRDHILCNIERFAAANDAEQYRLVHHEYAGLAGVEQNQGASSDYEISTQLTRYLTDTVRRLAIVPESPLGVKCAGKCKPEHFEGEYILAQKTPDSYCLEIMSLRTKQSEKGKSFTMVQRTPDWEGYFEMTYGANHKIKKDDTYVPCPSGYCSIEVHKYVEGREDSLRMLVDVYEATQWFAGLPIDPVIFGSLERRHAGLRPDPQGRVQYVVWDYDEKGDEHFVRTNCSYERVTTH